MTPLQWALASGAALLTTLTAVYVAALGYDEWLHRREQDAARDYWQRIGKDKP